MNEYREELQVLTGVTTELHLIEIPIIHTFASGFEVTKHGTGQVLLQSCLVQVPILDHHQALGESMIPRLEKKSSRTLQYWRIDWDAVILGKSVE